MVACSLASCQPICPTWCASSVLPRLPYLTVSEWRVTPVKEQWLSGKHLSKDTYAVKLCSRLMNACWQAEGTRLLTTAGCRPSVGDSWTTSCRSTSDLVAIELHGGSSGLQCEWSALREAFDEVVAPQLLGFLTLSPSQTRAFCHILSDCSPPSIWHLAFIIALTLAWLVSCQYLGYIHFAVIYVIGTFPT